LNKVGVLYGRMSVRLRAAQGAGTWPAFWTLGANIGTIGWPRCGEIDVVELAGYAPTTVWGTPHGPATGGAGAGSTTELSAPAHSDFHVYTVDWYPDRMIWYLDGKPFHIYRKSEYPTDWVFNSEQYMILNLAMGGGFGGAINPALNEANIAVDWIRVYKVNGVGQVIIH
jgi:beta-glucanase (GH16 family)